VRRLVSGGEGAPPGGADKMGTRALTNATLGLVIAVVRPAFAASPSAAQISTALGRSDVIITHAAKIRLPETAVEAYDVKAVTSDGRTWQFTTDGEGSQTQARDALLAAEAQAASTKYGNLRPRLFQQIQTMGPSDLVSVRIWPKIMGRYLRKE